MRVLLVGTTKFQLSFCLLSFFVAVILKFLAMITLLSVSLQRSSSTTIKHLYFLSQYSNHNSWNYCLTQHWIACIWGCIAFVEAGMSFGESLLTTTNWISHWYNTSYVEGGLQPIGWDHPWDRYFLSLFWSVQSITSIGWVCSMSIAVGDFHASSCWTHKTALIIL